MEENNVPKVICLACKKEKLITSFSINGRNGYRRKICKACIGLGITKVPDEVAEYRYCPACEYEKPAKEFYRNKAIITGYEIRCKICKKNRIKINKDEPRYPNRKPYQQEWTNYFNLVGITKNDYKSMFVFLSKVGYSLEESIHVQFCKKWGLTPKQPNKPFKNTFTPKDFNLV